MMQTESVYERGRKGYHRQKAPIPGNMDVGMVCAVITAIVTIITFIGFATGNWTLLRLLYIDGPVGSLSFAFTAYQTVDCLPLAMLFSLAAALTIARYVWERQSLLAPITLIVVWTVILLGVHLLDVGEFVSSIELYPAVKTLLFAGTLLSIALAATYGLGVLYEGVLSHHLRRGERRSCNEGVRRKASHM